MKRAFGNTIDFQLRKNSANPIPLLYWRYTFGEILPEVLFLHLSNKDENVCFSRLS